MGGAMRKKRGFLLILSLLIVLLLFVLGLSFLGKRATQYQRVSSAQEAAQSRALAQAGMEDAIMKLERDLLFPPLSEDQAVISYTEELVAGGARIGAYTVTIDGRYRSAPYLFLLVTAVGESGPDAGSANTRRTFTAEIDLSLLERYDYDSDGDFDDPNPYYRKVINFNDLGGF
jgi:Tfp pilus assembly protein PilX